MSNKSAPLFKILGVLALAFFSTRAPLAANDRIWILDPSFHLNQFSTPGLIQVDFLHMFVTPIDAVALQSDGKILIGGAILSDTGAYRGFARLLPDGEIDPDFQPGRTAASVRALAITPQQNIYTLNGADDFTESLAHYDSHGQIRWSHALSPRASYRQVLLALPDGSALVGGGFTNIGGVQRKFIALINDTGEVQSQFAPELNGGVTILARQNDGKILVGGSFSSVNGMPRSRIVRLMPDGQLDQSFNAGGLITSEPAAIALTSSGQILVSGGFSRANGSARDRLLRLNSDGSLDETFPAELDQAAYQLICDSQDRIVLAGAFTKIGGTFRKSIARLLSTGAVDSQFDPGTGPNGFVHALAIDSDGRYVIGGSFGKVGHSTVNGLARLLPISSTTVIDFAEEIFPAGEQYREAVVKLLRYGPAESEVIVDVWTDPGTNPELAEYKAFSTEVRFAANDREKTILIAFPDDGKVEFNELLPVHCWIRGENYIHTSQINIIDDEKPVLATGVIALPPGLGISAGAAVQRAVANSRMAFAGMIYSDAGAAGPSYYGVGVANLDGAPSTFTPAHVERAESALVHTLLWTSDDRLIVAGAFTSINGVPKANVVRFNLDGSIDNGFNPPSDINTFVAAVPNGKVLAVSWDTPNSANPKLVRLNRDGTIDPTFHATLPQTEVAQCIPLSDGKFLLNLGIYGIRRLLADGDVDSSFTPPRPFNYNSSRDRQIFALPDGKVLVQGTFTEVDGYRRPGLARLNNDGSLDLTFNPAFETTSAFLLTDGRILAGSATGLRQILNADGSAATDLIVPYLGWNPASGTSIQLIKELPDGGILDSALQIVPLSNRKLSSVTFDTTQVTIPEGTLSREILVKRIGDVSEPLTIAFSTNLIKGDAGDDIIVTPSTLTMAALQTQGAFRVESLADDWIELDENYKIRATNTSALFVSAVMDLVIQDQDGRPGSARFPPQLSNFHDAVQLATLDNGSIVVGGWTDEPLIVYNPHAGSTITLPPILPDERRLIGALAPIPSGFLVAGPFLGSSNAPVNVVFRFHSDGTRDSTFSSPPLSLFPRQILPEPGGTYLVTGFRGNYNVARLNSNGSTNRTYTLEFDPRYAALVSTNRLLYSSDYYSGVSCFDLTSGRAAAGFTPVQVSGGGVGGLIAGQNHFYICGWFSGVNGEPRPYIARFTLDGKLDSTYNPLLNGELRGMALDSQNRLVIFGVFTAVNGIDRLGAARLNFDGSLDTTFESDLFLNIPRGWVNSSEYLTKLPNGDILALVNLGGQNPYSAAIITSDSPLRANLSSNNGGFEIRLNTLPQKRYIIETSSNLSDWQPLITTNSSGYQLKLPLPQTLLNLFVRAKNSE